MALVTVVCTDRGQHPRRRISAAGRGPEDTAGVRVSRDGVPAAPPQEWHDGGPRWRCSTCGRTVELNRENWVRLFDGLADAGVSQVDMSRIPGT